MSRADLNKKADLLLKKNGYTKTGNKKSELSMGQFFFERRIIKTPMGNKSR